MPISKIGSELMAGVPLLLEAEDVGCWAGFVGGGFKQVSRLWAAALGDWELGGFNLCVFLICEG